MSQEKHEVCRMRITQEEIEEVAKEGIDLIAQRKQKVIDFCEERGITDIEFVPCGTPAYVIRGVDYVDTAINLKVMARNKQHDT